MQDSTENGLRYAGADMTGFLLLSRRDEAPHS